MNGNNMETDTTQVKQDEVNLNAETQMDCQVVMKSAENEDLENPFYPIVSVQVKEEPEDTEHRLTSPANDSGISPGHASNGSDSLGHQSPKQNGPCSIPDPYNRTESNPHSQEPPNQSDLALRRLAYQQFIQQTALFGIEAVRQAYFPNRDQNVGPKDVTLQPYHPHVVKQNNQWSIPIPIPRTSPSNRPASPSKRMSPFSGTASYPNRTSRPNTNSPPVNSPYSNTEPQGPNSTAPMIPPALNPGLSDDNSGTSSSHEGSMSEEYMEDSFYRKVEENPLRSLQMSLDRMENKDKFFTTDSNGLRNTFQCPFCAFNTLSRAEFNKHNEVHCPDLKCERCDFVTKKEEVLRTHAREAHLISPEAVGIEKEDIPGITVPKVNSQGKVKTSKCKQCGYIANTKVQFWDHIRGHIPPDKLLTCPRCPFVTEYKHHLEYHLRNHADSKPFRCDVCNYKCVNKSMLNSHLKSHSNIYQYRCNSCKYITKYCHSLKLHLRKYNHDPDTVLNPDGSPNPGPIIDVYGTRRGPKQRTKKVHNGKNANGISIVNPNIMEGVSIPKGTKNNAPYNFGFLPHLPMVPSGRLQYAVQPTFSANHIEAGYPMTMNQFVQDNSQYNKHENNIHNTYDQHYYTMNNYNNNNNTNDYEVKEMFQWKHLENVAHQAKEESTESNPSSVVVPLDLSRTETTRVENILKQTAENVTPLQTNGVQANIQETPQASTPRHRRKGPAFKLDDIARRLHQQSVIGNNVVAVEPKENSQNSINSGSSQNSASADRLSTANSRSENTEMLNISPPRNDSPPKDFNEECTFCHISFRNPVLHALHKGFHGFEDPFQCNRCGVRTGNEIAFNLHLTQTPHN